MFYIQRVTSMIIAKDFVSFQKNEQNPKMVNVKC